METDWDTDWVLYCFDKPAAFANGQCGSMADNRPPLRVVKSVKKAKGICSKCGKHIGRGIAVHIKHCEG